MGNASGNQDTWVASRGSARIHGNKHPGSRATSISIVTGGDQDNARRCQVEGITHLHQ